MGIFNFSKNFVGIDIGSSSVKVVEVSRFRKRVSLKNYAHLESATYGDKPFRAFEKETLFLSYEASSEAIKTCFEAAGISPEKAVFSLPDFSSFFVSFDLPFMSGNELVRAINFHASKYIPVPMSEIILDWKKIGPPPAKGSGMLHILAVAIPKKTMEQYRQVADFLKIFNFALEPEVFSLFRAFAPHDDNPLCIIDFGAKSTTLSLGDRNGVQSSHSLDVAVEKINRVLREKLKIETEASKKIIVEEGFNTGREEARHILESMISPLINAFNESWQSVQRRGYLIGTQRPQVVLVGGAAKMPGLQGYLASGLNTSVAIGHPFETVGYPAVLKPVMEEIGPSFSVAVGSALRVF